MRWKSEVHLDRAMSTSCRRSATTILTRQIIIAGLSFLLLSCGERPDSAEPTVSFEPVDSNSRSSQITAQTIQDQDNLSPYQQELNKLLSDPIVEQYYKDVYIQGRLIPAEDNKMLSIIDSLYTPVPARKLFYFIVFTKSMNGADGFYAEPLGLSALRFVRTRTEWFAEYFSTAPELTDQDMRNWAECIYGEFQIAEEGHELAAVDELEQQLIHNIAELRGEYRPVIEKLIEEIRSSACDKAAKQERPN